uniref:Uncharacterized protein n=1 Tax=Arcella intermedia TaxID=1963864 RepID=A0A6B2LBN1_9EUKA|eukprot:TRINITY_DN23393_c0_g1_i1.p1 TRINITY_DN23393_c0_g1~~TRINITY_DN23393_c0_g1_i1.p1  ORF type:complete len:293 (-),score=58.92 TRINITY_DN23393_c0_g1_i1:12-890(-)
MANPGTAVVTGGASGIGRAYAEDLLELGWNVTILDLADSKKTLQYIVQKFGNEIQKRLLVFSGDITNQVQMEMIFHKTISHFGSFDLLVNNAGVFNLLFQNLERTYQVNLVATTKNTEWFIKYATGNLRHPSRVPRNIIITAGSSGLIPIDSELAPAFVASKFGLVGLVRSLKFLGPKFGIRVNCICPVIVDTPMNTIDSETKGFLTDEGRGGIADPKECAKAMIKILDDPSIYGEVVTVHPSVGCKVESLDANNQFGYLGNWSFEKSKQVDAYLEGAIDMVRAGKVGWSYL